MASMSRWSRSKLFKLLGLYVLICLVLAVFINFLFLLIPFLLAGLLTFFLSPFVDRFEGSGLSRSMAVIVVYAAVALVLGGTGWFVASYVNNQAKKFQAELPAYTEKIEHMYKGLINDVQKMESKNKLLEIAGVSSMLGKSVKKGESSRKSNEIAGLVASSLGGALSSVLVWVGYLGLAPFLAFFFLRDGPAFKKSLIRMVPNRYFEMALMVSYEVDKQIRSFFKGQFIEALCVGILAWIGLWIIGLNYSFFIGGVAGVTNMIPYLGPVMGSIAGVGVALIDGLSLVLAAKVVIVLMIVQFIDSAILSTFIQSRSVDLHPLMVVFAVIVGGSTMGIWGMLLGVPILASTVVTMKILARGFQAYRI